jgi:hypothetical protein
MASIGMVAQYIRMLSTTFPLNKKMMERCKPHPGQAKPVNA